MLSHAESEAASTFPESAEAEISLLDLAIVVVRNRWLIAKICLAVTLIGLLASLVLPVRYTASTAILPPQQTGSASSSLMSQLGGLGSMAAMASGGSLSLKNPNDLQVALLKSRTVEDAMIDRYHLGDRYHAKLLSTARKRLESAVDIDSGAKDGIIRISVSDRDPQWAADMANGYVEVFKKFSATLAVTEASQRRLFFEQQLEQAKDHLAQAEEDLKRTEEKTGVIQLDAQARATIQLVADLRGQIAAKQAEITALRSFSTDENPKLQIALQELAGLQAQEQRMGATSEGAENALLPKGDIPQSSTEFVRKLREVKYNETIFELIARQYEMAKVDEARQGAAVQVVDRAITPDRHSFPPRILIVLGSLVFGLLLGVGWAFSRAALGRIADNPAERTRLDMLRGLISHDDPPTPR